MCNFYGPDELVIGRVYYHHWLNENRGYPVRLIEVKEDKDEILVRDGWGYEWPSRVQFLRPAVHYYEGWKPLA